MWCWFRIFAVDIQVLSGRQHGAMTLLETGPGIHSTQSCEPTFLEKQELGANIAIHDNKVIPNCRVCQCYGVLACVGNSSGTGRIQNQAAQHGILPAETISSFQRVLPNLVSLQVVNRTLLNVAISSFSEKYISPRGFNQMKNDRVRCLISKRMI